MVMLLATPLTVLAAKPKLNKTKIDVLCGKTYTLKANQKVTWVSSNPSVATINSKGKVTGKTYGTTKITAINKKGEKKTCTVSIKKYTTKRTGKSIAVCFKECNKMCKIET